MSATQIGIVAGLVLGLALSQGFMAFVVTLLLGVIGFLVGRVLDGELDLSELIGRGKDR